MLNAMLDAAVNWMRAGLPLKLLRIVIYTFNTEKLSREHEQLLKLFQEYKKNVEKALEKPKVCALTKLVNTGNSSLTRMQSNLQRFKISEYHIVIYRYAVVVAAPLS